MSQTNTSEVAADVACANAAAHSETYEPMTLKMAWQLAAPHTWPASIMPVLVASAAAYASHGVLWLSMTFALLIICILMQSAVNTFNDYFDYVKGTDSKDDNVEVSDAVLVYNNINPKSALTLAVGFLIVAFVLGIYAIWHAGYIPLVIALIGAVIVVLYSGGKTPISYLPIGEFVSGFVMGGLIVVACYHVLSGVISWSSLIWALPTVIGVALIMFTNNTCDIEKDIDASRSTLPVKLGRQTAKKTYQFLMIVWLLAIVIIVGIWFTKGLVILPFMLLACYPFLNVLWKNPLVPALRIAAMSQICTVNVVLGAFYAMAMFASTSLVITL